MYFATVALDNTITGLYSDSIGAPPPMGAITLSDQQYNTIVLDVQRWTIVDGELVQNPNWVDPNGFAHVQRMAVVQINSVADELTMTLLRSQDGGNALVLIQKKLEAAAYLKAVADNDPIVPADYPFLNGIATALALPLIDIVNSADLQIETWEGDAALIEAERARLFHAINLALTIQEVNDALATANWPS